MQPAVLPCRSLLSKPMSSGRDNSCIMPLHGHHGHWIGCFTNHAMYLRLHIQYYIIILILYINIISTYSVFSFKPCDSAIPCFKRNDNRHSNHARSKAKEVCLFVYFMFVYIWYITFVTLDDMGMQEIKRRGCSS